MMQTPLLISLLPDKLREYRVEPAVGHYGIFNGTIYRNRIAPRMMTYMQGFAWPPST